MKLLSRYHRPPQQFVGVWSYVDHDIIIIPVPLSQTEIKDNFPPFQLDKITVPGPTSQ